MSARLTAVLLSITEIAMLAYWLFALSVVAGLISVSPTLMYSNYDNPLIVSWNWSFFPIDVLFAISGLIARFARLTPQRKATLGVFSLSLMFCAGLMAISFWVLQAWFDPIWWGMNIWLIVLPTLVLLTATKENT